MIRFSHFVAISFDGETVCAIMVEGIMGNTHVKIF